MSEDNFINEIEFKEGKEDFFPPFKGGDKIFLGGQKEVENLIKFYLENKGIENWKENAERFKINCILGNNGGGKSTLLRGINDKLNSKDLNYIVINNENDKYSFNDNVSIFDYTKVNINNKEETFRNKKSKINEEIRSFMEFTKWTHDLGILGRFLKYICIYSYTLDEFKYKKDFLEDFLGFSLKDFNWEIKYGSENDKKKYNLLSIIDEYFDSDNEEYLNDFIDKEIGYNSKDKKTFLFGDEIKKIINLSSGQKIVLLRFSFYLTFILFSYEEFKEKLKKEGKTEEKLKDNPFEIVILIDEPDLHLHLDWQKQYIQKLIDVFSNLDTKIKLHFIIATHSPFIISDLPTESIVVLDGKESVTNNTEFTKIRTYDGVKEHKDFDNLNDYENYVKNSNKKTFGANFVDIIRDGFFFKNKVLMGSFAENVILDVAEIERKKIFLDSLKFQLEYKKHEKENIQGQINEINSFTELSQIFKKLKDETKDILKDILGDDFKEGDNKDDILNKIKSNYRNNIKELKNIWIKFKELKIKKEIKKIEKDINSINEEIEGYENNIQENIGDDFLSDNLLYFNRKNNAED